MDVGPDITWLGVDLFLSEDSEMQVDQQNISSAAGSRLLDKGLNDDTNDDSDDNNDDDSDDGLGLHPIMMPQHPVAESPADSANIDKAGSTDEASSTTDPPRIIQKLRMQLLNGYTLSNHPSFSPRESLLTPDEKLSLKHYIAWVDTHGTVNAYNAHAKVLKEATGQKILSLHMVRKLAMNLTDLLSQVVDMCPKSCMAFTGEFKDCNSCPYIHDKHHGACGEPRYDKKGKPRAQMLYTPIAPIIQSYYKNGEMAKAMRYRHEQLQGALQKLGSDNTPTEYSDFPNSINHINHYNNLHLFQEETDTAITISTDGAQLTMKKKSNVWVLIVTILNLPPNMRTKAENTIIPLIIPGPNPPGNVESFVYVLYQELAKLSVGVWCYDALLKRHFILKVYLCGVLGDMLGSTKLNRMAGHVGVYGCRFSMVRGARKEKGINIFMTSLYQFILRFSLIGTRAQYYPLTQPEEDEINNDRPPFDIFSLPIRKLQDYWETIIEINDIKQSGIRVASRITSIVRETGVSGLPICAASPAFTHPFFFPLDPFHLFYENCMPHIWDLWIKSDNEEAVHMGSDIASNLGAEIEDAMNTLPPSFCGPIRDPYKKRQSQYKIYEWMALLHWYIVPIAWELGFNEAVIKNFALFSNVIEYAMTTVVRTTGDLIKLQDKIILFLRGFENLCVGNDPSKIPRCRLCMYQLMFIPHHISYNGTIRFGSQSTCEQTIGNIGHGIRSKKAPFQNVVSYKTDKLAVRMLHLSHPTFFANKGKDQKTLLYKSISITKKQKETSEFEAYQLAIQFYLNQKSCPTLSQYGKCPLSNGDTLASNIRKPTYSY